MRIADGFEVVFPRRGRFGRQRVGFAGDAKHFPPRLADRLQCAGLRVASQLEATRRSPEPAIKEQQDEIVFR